MANMGKSVERIMYFGAKPELFNLAKEMRKNPTESERALWNTLRKFRKKGFLFRQQHPIYIFIADFYCHKLKLVIEVDGSIHLGEESQERDDGRTGIMENFGITVLRFTNDQVLYNQSAVIEQINEVIMKLSSPFITSP
jgi:very-short-patch-repair endonuclease